VKLHNTKENETDIEQNETDIEQNETDIEQNETDIEQNGKTNKTYYNQQQMKV